ncbi:hypothetical protein [Rhizobacter sp. Root404]|uniref:hypothetical protein n=1 Tax=Rhizobacter sp. Root404 TaxID=1736528 RepID=UPI0012F79050|nr:hypothetical protein [Rhizobacter sp. Root404]
MNIFPAPTRLRSSLSFAMTGGTLLILVAIIVCNSGTGPFPLRALNLLLIPLAVFLVSRFASTSAMYYVFALGLVALGVSLVFNALAPGMTDGWLWVQAAAFGLTGIGLLCLVRWAPYLWYATVLVLLFPIAEMVQEGAQANWHKSAVTPVLLGAMLWLMFGVGGAAVVARHTHSRPPPALNSPGASRRSQFDLLFGVLCVACSMWVAWNWFESRIPDTAGIDQLHPSLRSRASGGFHAPYCDKVTYCGKYVELSCHPEGDGPVTVHDNTTGALIMDCGGACMGGRGPVGTTQCSACPPPEWQQCLSARIR